MTSESARNLKAATVSLVLFAAVLWIALGQEIDFAQIRPVLLIPAVLAYSLVLICRAKIFRLLSSIGTQHPFSTWLSLSARHQLVFIISPSGAGDLAFPVLARKMIGLETLPAARLIAEARLRDVLAVLGIGCAGIAGTGHFPVPALVGMVLCFAALFWSDLSIRAANVLVRRFKRMRARAQAMHPPTEPETFASLSQRMHIFGLTLSLWVFACTGILAGFHAAGYPMSVAESFVMLAGLNVAGALAFSIAGFGVAEAGAAGVLVFLGTPLSVAAGIAIIARPLLLLSNCVASAVLELVACVLGARASAR
ncbi:uncharacterized membrane protein YbhN (UPF0104 family) [Roseovarius halotolerans]|uniref:Lysylphosphatidylglycerol synthase TM region n=1 Tax=Roseovarius halotolerans TaxID=505353 RepID=A0A1X6Y5K7_9RHOB|nr:lysylphosphatidylglycerol synthase transmembrane domain-containing protein [Roseovarius halotolerans]RKT35263.1 uncharacterized membrane protein YbhN (UPF0104 family) [Roseovarius halotolerans]SLN11395.1 hypothetical protein ROH8110_00100 [Roseovarius halotolerans]